jgi:uncharacterized membrane protein
MKSFNLFIISLMAAMAIAFSGCSDENETEKPVISQLIIGIENNHQAYIGSDLHVEAEIVAAGKIATVTVEIHSEGGSGDEIEAKYTDYEGQNNATFHKHIEIPDDTRAGEYHFHLTVTDMEGNSTTVEEDVDIEAAPVNITIENLTFGSGHDTPGNNIGYIGTAPMIEAASITAEKGIDKVVVEMHSENATEFEFDTLYAYAGETEITAFHKHINIPEDAPAGDYHVHFNVYDQSGGHLEKSIEVEIKETGIAVTDIEIGDNNSANASNIHTEFKVTAADPLKSIRLRIYKAETPTVYVFNETYTDDFAAGEVKSYTFHKHLNASSATPAAGNYVIEIRITDSKGAYKTIKDVLNITV